MDKEIKLMKVVHVLIMNLLVIMVIVYLIHISVMVLKKIRMQDGVRIVKMVLMK